MTEAFEPQLTLLRSKAENLVSQLEEAGDLNDNQELLLQELRVYQAELEIQNQQLRETQEQLQQTLERANCLYHQSPIGYVTIDQKGQIQDLNESFATMLGYPISRLRLSYLADFCTKETADILRQRLPAFYKKPQDKILDVAFNTSASGIILVEILGRLLPGEPLLACNVIDRTQRKQAEAGRLETEIQLQLSRDRLQHWHHLMQFIIHHDPNAIAVLDRHLHFLFVSDRFLKDYGVSRKDIIGKHHYEIFPDIPEKWRIAHQRALDGEVLGSEEDEFIRADGKKDYTRWLCRPWYDDDGSISGIILYTEVITERKKMEKMLSTRTAELEQRTEELERFNYTVSHDLKSPLVTVKTFLGFLEQDMRAADTEKIAQDIDHIRTAADRMSLLLDDLLSLSRLGWVADQPERVSLKGLLEHALMLVQGQIQETSTQIRLLDTDLLLHADPSHLLELWQNLIDNALTYGVTKENPYIDIGVESGAEPVFYVRDYGPGVAKEFHEKIFGLFEKLDRNSKGSGLGLALVKRIVAKHGGKIWVESSGNGQGCCFKFTLPKAFAQAEGNTDDATS